MPRSIPVGDVLRAVVPTNWRWVRYILDRLKGIEIRRGDTTIQLDEKPGGVGPTAVPPPRTGLDQPHRIAPNVVRGPRR
jgi:hypothetical protein